jgi:hypothetical protein
VILRPSVDIPGAAFRPALAEPCLSDPSGQGFWGGGNRPSYVFGTKVLRARTVRWCPLSLPIVRGSATRHDETFTVIGKNARQGISTKRSTPLFRYAVMACWNHHGARDILY